MRWESGTLTHRALTWEQVLGWLGPLPHGYLLAFYPRGREAGSECGRELPLRALWVPPSSQPPIPHLTPHPHGKA